jgi:glutaredoxin
MLSRVMLYMRPGCHLCEDAASLLRRLGCAFTEVNIDEDAELLLRYNERVPVIAAEGRELLEGIIRESEARAALKQHIGRAPTA